MRVAIAGAGNVGLFIANDLAGAGHDVQLLEQSPDIAARLNTDPGVEVVVADACEVSSLRTAGLERCDVVVAATGDDEDNLVVSLLSKQEFAVPRVIARVNHPKNQWMFDATWGVDIAVSTPHLITSLVDEAVSVGRLPPVSRRGSSQTHGRSIWSWRTSLPIPCGNWQRRWRGIWPHRRWSFYRVC